jgi:HAD superfamily phosphoserine phosphatase-like hydrolase
LQPKFIEPRDTFRESNSNLNAKKGISAFDLDHTLLNANSSFRFGFFLYKNHFFKLKDLMKCLTFYARHKWFGLSIEELHHKSFGALFRGKSFELVRSFVDEFLEQQLQQMTNPSIFLHLENAKKNGHHCAILSSAPDFLVRPIAKKWGIHLWYATSYQTDLRGNFTKIAYVMEGEEKAKTLLNLAHLLEVDPSSITVYSDSALDLPLLNIAGKAIGVFPDRKLRKVCYANHWEILE